MDRQGRRCCWCGAGGALPEEEPEEARWDDCSRGAGKAVTTEGAAGSWEALKAGGSV